MTSTSLQQAGVTFAFVKATEGTYNTNASYSSQVAGLASIGAVSGPYQFFDFRNDGKVQADTFVNFVNARGGFHGHLRPVVDVECPDYLGTPNWTAAASRLRAFVNEVYARVGVKPVLYTSIQEWHNVTGGNPTFGDCPLWSAEWAQTAPLKFPPGWTSWTFWQYGSATVPGTTWKPDGDLFSGPASALANWIVK